MIGNVLHGAFIALKVCSFIFAISCAIFYIDFIRHKGPVEKWEEIIHLVLTIVAGWSMFSIIMPELEGFSAASWIGFIVASIPGVLFLITVMSAFSRPFD